MKKIFLPIFVIAIVIIGLGTWFSTSLRSVSSDSSLKDFVIIRGSSASEIGNKLQKEGLIKSSLAFKIYVQVTASQKDILAGEYRLSPSYTLPKIVDQLKKGPSELWVTIPEGLRKEEVVEKYIEVLDPPDPSTFRQEFLSLSTQSEGFLFPDTYLFPKTASPSAIVKRMTNVFDLRVNEKMKSDIESSSRTLGQVITMASILERETITDAERPVVSGILYKRLDAGWPLQADATLQYAKANAKCQMLNAKCEWWPKLVKEDLEISSPYNSYRFVGLPPAPIANPGLSSIKAAIYPTESSYWYYLHDSSGEIHYAETLEEHNDNIRMYLDK